MKHLEDLNDKQKEALEGSDVVLIPVGGKPFADFEHATKIATALEPFFIIPHSYAIPNLKTPLDKLDKFMKEMGYPAEPTDKLAIKKKELMGDVTKVLVLSPQR